MFSAFLGPPVRVCELLGPVALQQQQAAGLERPANPRELLRAFGRVGELRENVDHDIESLPRPVEACDVDELGGERDAVRQRQSPRLRPGPWARNRWTGRRVLVPRERHRCDPRRRQWLVHGRASAAAVDASSETHWARSRRCIRERKSGLSQRPKFAHRLGYRRACRRKPAAAQKSILSWIAEIPAFAQASSASPPGAPETPIAPTSEPPA